MKLVGKYGSIEAQRLQRKYSFKFQGFNPPYIGWNTLSRIDKRSIITVARENGRGIYFVL